jgi:GxxExxY protein
MLEVDDITGQIISAAIEVHNWLGPGLLESVYEQCLLFELRERGMLALGQVALPVVYKEHQIDLGYRMDILVEDSVVIELKACTEILPIHKAQLFSYLKLSNREFGLLINFNTRLLKHGITRVLNPSFIGCSQVKFYCPNDKVWK